MFELLSKGPDSHAETYSFSSDDDEDAPLTPAATRTRIPRAGASTPNYGRTHQLQHPYFVHSI